MNRQILHNVNLKALLCLTISCLCVSTSFAANLVNQSMADMQNNYYGASGQFGTTFSLKDEDGSDTGKENIPLADIYRQNIAISVPSGYTETTNGNFQLTGTKQYAIVDNPNKLNSSLNAAVFEYNHLVMHNVASNQDILKFNIKNFDVACTDYIYFKMTIESVYGLAGGASTRFGLYLGDEMIDEVVVITNENGEYTWMNEVEIKKTKLSSAFTLSLRRIDSESSADNCVLAFSEIMMTGKASVVSGISITKTVDEGETIGSSVTIVANAASGIAESDVKWERKSSDGSWENLSYTGLKLVDIPQKPGDTYYRAKYYDGVWNFSNEVKATRYMGCAATSKVLWSEDFGTLMTRESRNSSQYVKGYSYVSSGNVGDGSYAVVANPRTAGSDGCAEESCYWFRDICDHTQGKPIDNIYGGMLLVNCKSGQQSNDIVMERKIQLGCKNTFVNFSAWFANAGWDRGKGDSNPINMIIRVLSPSGSEIAKISVAAQKSDGWKNGTVSFYNKEWEDENLTLQIINNGVGGGGNDVLIDDISFTICRPDVKLSASIDGVDADNLEDIRTSCGGTVKITADPTDTYKSIYNVQNPYYKWLKSDDNVTWSSAGKAGAGSSYKVIDVTASGSRTYYKCVIGPDQSDVDGYISNPESYSCSSVAEASYASVRCPANVTLDVTRTDCNTYKFSLSAIGETVTSVKWYIGSDECGWSLVGQTSSNTTNYSLTSDDIPTGQCKIYFKGVATNNQSLWALSYNPLTYKEIGLTSVINTQQTVGCNIVYDMSAEYKENGVTTPASQYFFTTSDGSEIQSTSSSKCQIRKSVYPQSDIYNVTVDGLCMSSTYIDMTCPQINYSNVCNKYTFTLTGAMASDVVEWSYGNDNAGWDVIQGESKSTLVVEDVSKLFSEEAVQPFEIRAVIKNGPRASVPVAYTNVDVYGLKMFEPQVLSGDDCVKQFSLSAESQLNYSVNDNPLFFYEKGKPELLCESYSSYFDPESCTTPYIDYSTTFYVTTEEGCYAEASVEVGCIKLTETHVCNQYTFTVSNSKGGAIKWEYGMMSPTGGINWTEIKGVTGTTYSVDISTLFDFDTDGGRYIRVTEGSISPYVLDISQYKLTLKADPSEIKACGDVSLLTADLKVKASQQQFTPTQGQFTVITYTFYKKGDSQPICEDSPDPVCGTNPIYSDATFVVTAAGCEAETPVTVDLVWPTVFTPYTAGSTNVKFEVCAKSLKIFDRNGNMIADIQGNAWDGYCTTGSSSGNMAMPGVYFYVATLDDDTIKKGTVEIFKSKDNK